MHNFTLKEICSGLRKREFSTVDLVLHYFERIESSQRDLNSFISNRSRKELIEEAKAADSARSHGDDRPLLGLPIAHKDLFCTRGIPTTCGSKTLANFIPPYDAFVVERLKKAGTILLGKTNLDEFAMGSSNEHSYFGRVANPWALDRVSGGSSGGSAAAVAARLVPIATGTDTGGSVRLPASYCNLVGFKPTYGTISRWGMIAFSSSLDQAGLFGRSVADIAPIFEELAKHDPRDATSTLNPDLSIDLNPRPEIIKGLKIGLIKEFFSENLDPETKAMVLRATDKYKEMGAELCEVSFPLFDYSLPCYYIIACSECSSNLARYDGIRYGYRTEKSKNLDNFYRKNRGQGLGDEVKHRIILGVHALSSEFYNDCFLKAQKLRRLLSNQLKGLFQEVDILLTPTANREALKFGEKMNDRVGMYMTDTFTTPASLLGTCALSLPAGLKNGLPIGFQLIGSPGQDQRLLEIAHQFQLVTDYHLAIPRKFVD